MHLVGTKPNHSQRRVWLAYAMLVVMNCIDVIYTGITFGDPTTTLFPSHMVQQFGLLGIIAIKLLFLLMLGFIINAKWLHAPYQNVFYLFVAAYGWLTIYHTIWFFGFTV